MKSLKLSLIAGLLSGICLANPKRQTWEKSYHVWDFGLISACDVGVPKNPEAYFASDPKFIKSNYQTIKAGDIVWVQCRFIPDFCKEILPTLNVPVVLLICDGDESFPSNCGKNFNINELLDNKNIVHIFTQNYDGTVTHPKISLIPIGNDFHTVAYKGIQGGWGEKGSPLEQEAQLAAILKTLKPTYARKKRIYVDFQHSDSMHGEFNRYLQFGEDRTSIFKKIVSTGLVDHGQWMRRTKLWKTKGDYAFSVSPHGNGLDCHRTWEDLMLGCIVIVKTSSLDPLYEGLPVVIVKDWSEINQKNLELWLKQYGDAFHNSEYRKKLTHQYWFSKIKEKTIIN